MRIGARRPFLHIVARTPDGTGSASRKGARQSRIDLTIPPAYSARAEDPNMTSSTLDQKTATGFLQEHRDLMRTVTSLRQWSYELAELGIPKYEEMAWRVQEFRDRLDEHFVHEEQGGYLGAALAAAPQCAQQADRLLAQHGEFLGCLDRFIERLKAVPPKFTHWQEARDEFDAFLARLRDHEAAENSIVHAALGHVLHPEP